MNLRFAIPGLVLSLVALAGCRQPQVTKRPPVVEQASATESAAAPAAQDAAKPAIASGPVTFAPAKIGVLPLTELSSPAGAGPGAKLDVFVTMLDAFGCQMKAPGVLLFELYEYVPRSAQLKGKQLVLWPQIDLTGLGREQPVLAGLPAGLRVRAGRSGRPRQDPHPRSHLPVSRRQTSLLPIHPQGYPVGPGKAAGQPAFSRVTRFWTWHFDAAGLDYSY